ncbi:RcnB family protein [Sphingopyxis terrae]|uniref:RcnB family protein n=1 Tax=Sphingopyxis terrae TaxID=33052 RepID=UPI000787AED4|nr:RcnB family protein [Sphingopyxis terrae]
MDNARSGSSACCVYLWCSYRDHNRSYYRMPRYYNPYRGRNYTRFSIGFSLGSLFYSQRYWINDPGYYRLPPAYGPYRWVRYYDDALLVNTYTGQVVDVIYDFFW